MVPRISRRRSLSALAGVAAAIAAPALAARDGKRFVGYFSGGAGSEALAKALAGFGYREGRDLRIEVRKSDLDPSRLAASAAEIVALAPEVIVANGPRVVAVARATRTIPIVCMGIPDPVGSGIARSLRQPGGNVTGLSNGSTETARIIFDLLLRLRPGLKRIAAVHSPGAPVEVQMRAHAAAARDAGLQFAFASVTTVADAERVTAAQAGEALWFAPIENEEVLKAVVAGLRRHRIVGVGGNEASLMSYSRYFDDPMGRVAVFVDRILRGTNPGTIPFEEPDRTELMINRSVARSMGIQIPADILLRATEVID